MITLNGDNIIETSEKVLSVKELRARKQAINAEIDRVKLEPDMMLMPNDSKTIRLEALKNEKQEIIDILNSVNLS